MPKLPPPGAADEQSTAAEPPGSSDELLRLSRRGLLRASAAVGGLVLAGAGLSIPACGLSVRKRRWDRRPAPDPDPPFVLPTESFYRFTNGPPPKPVTPGEATLSLGNHASLRVVPWGEVLALPTTRIYRTLQCDGNGYHDAGGGISIDAREGISIDEKGEPHPPPENWNWRFGGVGNATWDVIPIVELYQALGLELKGPWLRAVGHDDFAQNVPVELAQRRALCVAVGMNGEPLGHEHGGPGRLLVPGQYGMMSVKWLRELSIGELEDARVFDGGPDPHYPVKPLAWATFPADGERVSAEKLEARGIAFAGEQAVKEVLLWVNPAEIWTAELVDKPEPYVWCRWRATIEVPPGANRLHIACVDTLGRHSQFQEPWGDAVGYGGFHELDLVAT